MRRGAIGLLLLPLAAACSMDPHYARPAAPVPASWPVGDAYLRQSEAALPTVTYREMFGDPRLQGLIVRALAGNQDLAIAAANIERARAAYRVQRAALLPTVTGSGQVIVTRNSSTGGTIAAPTGTGATGGGGGAGTGTIGGGGGSNSAVTTGGSGVNDNYRLTAGLSAFEIDLFGRVRSLTRATVQDYLGTEAAARAVRVSLVGELANAWLTYAADRSLMAIAQDTRTSAVSTVRLTQARLQGGIAPRTDLAQAQTILERAESDLAQLTTLVAQDRNAIDLLVGSPVADADLPATLESVDGTLGEVPAGLDATILLRRPDVVQAEYALRAANARIGAARAAFFPRISLTALAGLASGALGSLFQGDAFTWQASPTASLPIFDGGALRGNLNLARANGDLAIAQYRQTIQIAFREVSDALARRGTIDAQLAAETRLAAAAEDTLRLSTASYRGGITLFLNTLDAQRSFYSARQTLVQARLVRATNRVTLYRVLGGDALIDPGAYGSVPSALATPAPTR
ncbi:MAG: efflux transporter outer membrane subunit [Sphingomonas fennica]